MLKIEDRDLACADRTDLKGRKVAGKSKPATNEDGTGPVEPDAAPEIIDATAEEIDESLDEPLVVEEQNLEVEADSAKEIDDIEDLAPTDDNDFVESADEFYTADEPDPLEPEPSTPSASAPVAPAAEEPASNGSGLGMVIGGLIAGGIGFAIATFAPMFSDETPEQPVIDVAALTASIDSNSSKLTMLGDRINVLENAPVPQAQDVDLSGVEGNVSTALEQIEGLSSEVEEVRNSIDAAQQVFTERADALDARIAAIEAMPASATNLGSEEELAAFRASLQEMTDEAEERVIAANERAAEIEMAAKEEALAAERSAAIAKLEAALESGAAFSDLLPLLGSVPDVLSEHAETGLVTINDLQKGFPSAARAVLAMGEDLPEDASAGQRLTAFLKRQTGARSLAPQDGDSADAILSRAEAGLAQGDLTTVVEELNKLPDGGKDALAGWLGQVETRLSALNAVRDITETN